MSDYLIWAGITLPCMPYGYMAGKTYIIINLNIINITISFKKRFYIIFSSLGHRVGMGRPTMYLGGSLGFLAGYMLGFEKSFGIQEKYLKQ